MQRRGLGIWESDSLTFQSPSALPSDQRQCMRDGDSHPTVHTAEHRAAQCIQFKSIHFATEVQQYCLGNILVGRNFAAFLTENLTRIELFCRGRHQLAFLLNNKPIDLTN